MSTAAGLPTRSPKAPSACVYASHSSAAVGAPWDTKSAGSAAPCPAAALSLLVLIVPRDKATRGPGTRPTTSA